MANTDAAQVSVWRLPLTGGPDENRLLSLLEPAEWQRAQRYGSSGARRRFLLCRAALRCLLAERLNAAPDLLRLVADPYGKPHLADRPAGLSFNLSHTNDLALIALSNGPLLGVDVEAWRPARSLRGIAQRCFAKQEFERWQSLAETEQVPAFFSLWTRKEAFAKAVGRGIALGLERIVFNESGQLAELPPDCGAIGDWWVRDLDAGDGYSAAVAVEDAGAGIDLRDFKAPGWP